MHAYSNSSMAACHAEITTLPLPVTTASLCPSLRRPRAVCVSHTGSGQMWQPGQLSTALQMALVSCHRSLSIGDAREIVDRWPESRAHCWATVHNLHVSLCGSCFTCHCAARGEGGGARGFCLCGCMVGGYLPSTILIPNVDKHGGVSNDQFRLCPFTK